MVVLSYRETPVFFASRSVPSASGRPGTWPWIRSTLLVSLLVHSVISIFFLIDPYNVHGLFSVHVVWWTYLPMITSLLTSIVSSNSALMLSLAEAAQRLGPETRSTMFKAFVVTSFFVNGLETAISLACVLVRELLLAGHVNYETTVWAYMASCAGGGVMVVFCCCTAMPIAAITVVKSVSTTKAAPSPDVEVRKQTGFLRVALSLELS